MPDKDIIFKEIELLRQRLNKLIEERQYLQDEEIIKVSTLLDAKLNEHNQVPEKIKNAST